MAKLRTIFVAVAAVGLCFVTVAEAQQGRRGGGTPLNQGNIGRRQAAEQDARTQQMMSQQKAAFAKAERDRQFAANIAGQQAQIDAVKAAATSENRALTPAEEAQIAALSQRIARMTANREAVVAAVEEQKDKARETAKEAQDRNQALREDRCRAAGVHVARIDRPKGRGC